MAYYPADATGLVYMTYPAGPTALATTLTANASANTKGVYAEMVASSAAATNWLQLQIILTNITSMNGVLCDIATGAAASEVVLIPNIYSEGNTSGSVIPHAIYGPWPVDIAASTRIACRIQGGTGGVAIQVVLTHWNAGDTDGATAYTAIGVSTTTSAGPTVDPGGSANTKGAYTEIVASSAALAQVLTLETCSDANAAPTSATWYLDVATGAAASEVVLIPDMVRTSSGTTECLFPRSNTVLTYIAASTRIAVRSACSVTDATDRILRVGMLLATGTTDTAYPQSTTGLQYITYVAGPSSGGTELATPGGANAKGAYTELTGSTAFACKWAEFTHVRGDSVVAQILFDIATGAAASEVVIVPDLISEQSSGVTGNVGGRYVLPLALAIGTRIAARYQGSDTAAAPKVAIALSAAGLALTPNTYVTYGADTSDSGGTGVDPGAVANTKGAYSQLTASTSAVAQQLLIMATAKANGSYAASTHWAVDLATGAGGAEVVLIADLRFNTDTGQEHFQELSHAFITYIAASTRLAARASCGSTDATDRLIDVAVSAATQGTAVGGGAGTVPVFQHDYRRRRVA